MENIIIHIKYKLRLTILMLNIQLTLEMICELYDIFNYLYEIGFNVLFVEHNQEEIR